MSRPLDYAELEGQIDYTDPNPPLALPANPYQGQELRFAPPGVRVLPPDARLQRGGNAILGPDLPTSNAEVPLDWTFLLEWSAGEKPIGCELQIQLQYQEAIIGAGGFPDGTYSIGFSAGARLDGSNVWDWADPVIMKIEAGGGENARVFYCDLRPGRFSLGIQKLVRVSFARWIRGDPGANIAVQGSVAPSEGTDADAPTYSASIQIPAGETRTMTAPPGALWWDFDLREAGSIVQATTFQGGYYKDTTIGAPQQTPPVTPYPWLTASSQVAFENLGAATVTLTVTFWVR